MTGYDKKNIIIKRVYNLFILLGILMAGYLCSKQFLTKFSHMDTYLSSKYAYTTLADMVNIHSESGLRLKIPKPILFQVARDLLPMFAGVKNMLDDVYLDCKEAVVGEDDERKAKRMQRQQKMQPLLVKPTGASLLYVSSFCKEVFGPTTPMETCRAELRLHCQLDVLSWFEESPAESLQGLSKVQDCLTRHFKQNPDFVSTFNTKIKMQEHQAKTGSVAPKKGQKLFIVGFFMLFAILVLVGGIRAYQIIQKSLRDKELEDRMRAIDGKVVNLGPEGIQDEPDLSVCCDALLIDDYNIEELEEFLEAPTLILLEVQPIFEFDTSLAEEAELPPKVDGVTNEVVDFDENEFVVADLIDDITSDLLLWAIFIHQVFLDDAEEEEFETEDPPPMFTLDMSWQENLLENARVGITTIHSYDFEVDGNGATEDNIMVTGLTVDKDDPLKFVFWKKRLRDVREELKADALAKLKEQCPTLFAMGWFKENLPKQEEELQHEDEELRKEALLKEEEEKTRKETLRSKERQISNDLFVSM